MKTLYTSYPKDKNNLITRDIHMSTNSIYILYTNVYSQLYIYTGLFTYTQGSVCNSFVIHKQNSINGPNDTRIFFNFQEIYTRSFTFFLNTKGETH